MAVDIPALREIVERVCTRNDVLNACKRRDIGTLITVLCAQGITQGQLSVLTGIPQGRLSEYKTHKRTPTASSTFEAFADGLGMPPAARRALGLDSETAGSGLSGSPRAQPATITGTGMADVRPVLTTLSRASAVPVLSGLREVHRGYLEADRLMGSICIIGSVQLQMPVVERLRSCPGSRPGRDTAVRLPVHGVRRLALPRRWRSDVRFALDGPRARLRPGSRRPACCQDRAADPGAEPRGMA